MSIVNLITAVGFQNWQYLRFLDSDKTFIKMYALQKRSEEMIIMPVC